MLTATQVTASDISLAWPQATDDVGVVTYQLFQDETPVVTLKADITAFTVVGLDSATEYSFRLSASDAAGNVSETALSLAVQTADDSAPDWPLNAVLTAQVKDNNEVLLGWSQATDDVQVVTYRVYQDNKKLEDVSAAQNSLLVSGLSAGVMVAFRVQALDNAGNESTNGPRKEVTLLDATGPAWPDGAKLEAKGVTATSLTLHWSSATDDVGQVSYRVFRNQVLLQKTAKTDCIVNGLTPGMTYAFRVEAVDEASNPSSESLTLKVQAGDDSPPVWTPLSTLVASKIGATQLTLGWTPATDDVAVTGYEVVLDDKVIAETTDETWVVVSGLNPVTTYTLMVRARDGAGNVSAKGPFVTAETLGQGGVQWPDDATLTVSDLESTSLKLTWPQATHPDGAVTYRVFVDQILLAGTDQTFMAVTGLSAGHSYTFRVEALDIAQKQTSNGPTIMVQTDDNMPPVWAETAKLIVSNVEPTQVTLGWSLAEDNVMVTGYQVILNDKVVAETEEQPFAVINKLTPLTEYTFSVRAKDSAGNVSSGGPSVSVKTTDGKAPMWPDSVALSVKDLTGESLVLSWPKATDDVGPITYWIFKNQVLIATTNKTSYSVSGLSSGVEYTFVVEAVDSSNNQSLNGPSVILKIGDEASPVWGPGAELTVTQIEAYQVTLGWTPATDNVAVSGYQIVHGSEVVFETSGQTSAVISGLSALTEYTFFVRAKDGAGNVSLDGPSVTTKTTDVVGPVWPADALLTAQDVTSASLTLKWTSAQDETGPISYRVYQDKSLLGTTQSTTYDVEGLKAGVSYTFFVEALDGADNVGGNSPKLTVKTDDSNAPVWLKSPQLSASKVGATQVTLGWTPATDDVAVSGYELYGDGQLVAETVNTSVTVNELSPLTKYVFTVRARDGAGNLSSTGPSVTVTTIDSGGPTWPVSAALTVSDLHANSLRLNWSAATDDVGVIGYRVYRSNVQIGTTKGDAWSFEVTDLLPWKTYHFRVEAEDAAGAISLGGPKLSVQTPDETAPTWHAKSQLLVSDLTPESLTLTWNGASDDVNITHYEVHQGGQLLGTVVFPTATIAVTGLSPWTGYSFRVEAVDVGKNVTANGPKVSVKTTDLLAPAWPEAASFQASAVKPNEVSLTWSNAIDDVAVVLYRVFADDTEVGTVAGDSTSLTVTQLNPWTDYVFHVLAEDEAKNLSAKGPTLAVKTTDEQAPYWLAEDELTVGALGPVNVQLLWPAAKDDAGVVGYRVYAGGVLVSTVTGNQAMVTKLNPETEYTFSVQAGDDAGNWTTSGLSLVVTTASNEITNESVYNGLKPTCVGCHSAGFGSPFFESLEAFENGLAQNTDYVAPGDPDNSELVKLLEATSESDFGQMPLGKKSESFVAKEAAGQTYITMAKIRKWIKYLPMPSDDDVKAPGGALNERKRVEHIVRNLYDQLGLTHEDFYGVSTVFHDQVPCMTKTYLRESAYPLVSPDAHYVDCGGISHLFTTEDYNTWLGLGGPHWRQGVRRSQDISPGFLIRLTQLSKDYCRKALIKEGNDAVLKYANLSHTSQDNALLIRQNIEYLHLRLLGEVASQQTVDELFELFKVYEAGVEPNMKGDAFAIAGWKAVCSSLIRSPLWITY